MTLPASLIDSVKKGKAILFLGSGALIGASIPGKKILLGDDLRDLLNNHFLGGEFGSDSLEHVAALAISQKSLFTVQDFIGEYLRDLHPAKFHLKIPEFKWRALFTTNYDRLIESCYEENHGKIQDYVLMLSNSDKIDETRITNDKVPLIKLHGCITRTHDADLPLILTIDQYNESRDSRKRLFTHLYELAYENSIIFIGHSLQDTNIRAVLLQLFKEVPDGERHYLIKPGIKDAECEYWSERKITSLDYSFEKFLYLLDTEVSKLDRNLSLVRPVTTHPIEKRFTDHSKSSKELFRYLTDFAEYVSEHTTFSQHPPEKFFKGVDLGWFSVADGLSIRRSISKRISQIAIEKPEGERKSISELYVIKGEAGSGKTILMRQLVWDSKNLGIGIFIWIKSGTSVNLDVITEIYKKTNERVFLIWDDAARNSQEISKCFSKAKQDRLPITIITSERFSEWNTRCDELDDLVTGIFKLPYLNEDEIVDLIGRLETYGCLGPNLISKSEEERKREFMEIHGRQLLVALYEATMGESFEDIIHDEYSHISPESAKEIYLTVCTLNRMRVPVRAGLISRIHGVSFEKFRQNFIKPLEQVVITEGVGQSDIHYKSRHPEIAEIVFRRALTNSVDRYHEYIRILKKLNISYESDRTSFRGLIKAKALHELFPDHEDVKKIYEHALKSVGEDHYLFQQMANYERIRPSGNFERAIELLEMAINIAPYDSSIHHSLAIVWRDRARLTEDATVKKKYRGESRVWLEKAVKRWGDSDYISCTLVDLELDNLEDSLADDSVTDRNIDEAVRRAEKKLLESKRKFPSDKYIFTVEARFAGLLKDNERAISALKKSFSEDDRDPYIATRLATIYKEQGEHEKALKTIQSALERRPTEHRLNFQYAELLRQDPKSEISAIIYYYQRAYTPGDSNYQAQFWHARFLFESKERTERQKSMEIFDALRSVRLSFDARTEVRDYIGGMVSPINYLGALLRKKKGYGFISVDGSGQELFCPCQELQEDLWDILQVGDRLNFKIGFSYHGPVCCDVEIK